MINTEHQELTELCEKLFLPLGERIAVMNQEYEELNGIYTSDMPVEWMALTRRTKNTLKRYGVHQVSQLSQLTLQQLKRLRGLGEKGRKEINQFLPNYRRG